MIEKKVKCSDCPFTEYDRKARKMTDDQLKSYYANPKLKFFEQKIKCINGKLHLDISRPCLNLKAISFKCGNTIDLTSLIRFIGEYFLSKKDLTKVEARSLLLILSYLHKIAKKQKS